MRTLPLGDCRVLTVQFIYLEGAVCNLMLASCSFETECQKLADSDETKGTIRSMK